jgi:(S)-sulfolactate dehydrogenase
VRVVITEFMEEAAVAALRQRFDVVHEADLVDRRDDLFASVATADGLIVRNRTQVDAALVAAAVRLKVIGRLGVGLDNIDVPACEARGIQVIPARGANALAVAEYVIGAAMHLLRGTFLASESVAAGEWPRNALSHGREIAGKTLGVVGFGSIGQLTGRLARALGMTVIGFDAQIPASAAVWAEQHTAPRRFDDLLRNADVVSLHVPLTPATRHLIDAEKLALMKPDAVLINSARGGVVDEEALAVGLRAGKLYGAALDVFESEPLPAGSPLAGCPNLILTPHVAGLTREANFRVSTMIAERVAVALGALAAG